MRSAALAYSSIVSMEPKTANTKHSPRTSPAGDILGDSSVLAVFGSGATIDHYADAADRIRGLIPLLGF